MKVLAIIIVFFSIAFNPILSQGQVYQLGSKWHETEGGISGVWERRGNTNIFDGKWENGAVAVLEMELTYNKVKIKRKDTAGPSAGWEITYEGTFSADGKTIKGNEWYPGGQTEWSATIESQTFNLGSKWNEIEGGIPGVWERRGNSNIFDGKWENGAVAVLEMELTHNKVKIKRKDTAGPSAGWEITYEGTFSADGKTIKGNEWYPGGQTEWSAKIDVPTFNLGSKWNEIEGGIPGVWERRGNSNIFDGKWENGAVAVLEMELTHNKVKIKRKDTAGPSAGWEITYEGTISADGKTVKGNEWYPGGQTEWLARIEQ